MGGRAPVLAYAFLLIAACAACGTTTSSSPPSNGLHQETPAAASAMADPTDCQARVEHATFDQPETIDLASSCRFTAGGVAAAAAVLRAGASRDATWAAIWVYSSLGTDPAPLRSSLGSADASVRAMAGAASATLGEHEGLVVLLALVADETPLLGSVPPTSIGEFAVRSLARLIVADGAPDGNVDIDTLAQVAKAWHGWLDGRLTSLTYDADIAGWNR